MKFLLFISIFFLNSYVYSTELEGTWLCLDDGPQSIVIEKITYKNNEFTSKMYTSFIYNATNKPLNYETLIKGSWSVSGKKLIYNVHEVVIKALNDRAKIHVESLKKKFNSTNSYNSNIHHISSHRMSYWSSTDGIIYCNKE